MRTSAWYNGHTGHWEWSAQRRWRGTTWKVSGCQSRIEAWWFTCTAHLLVLDVRTWLWHKKQMRAEQR